ncbi:MAG: hypothetical protein JXB05_05785 [Myxococcaceae bacterium]|nr:hypothetical protein [Myxococcaceae bacterium]
MSYGMLVGCALLGASAVACGGARTEAPLIDEERPVAVSSGQGGAGGVEPGEWATAVPPRRQQQRALYDQVANELGLEQALGTAGRRAPAGEAVGGGGRAGGEGRSCAEVLAADAPAAVVSGTLEFASNELLILSVSGREAVKLRADEDTCAVQARQELARTESLLEGTEVRVSYVMKDGIPTARVVRAEPVRPLR